MWESRKRFPRPVERSGKPVFGFPLLSIRPSFPLSSGTVLHLAKQIPFCVLHLLCNLGVTPLLRLSPRILL